MAGGSVGCSAGSVEDRAENLVGAGAELIGKLVRMGPKILKTNGPRIWFEPTWNQYQTDGAKNMLCTVYANISKVLVVK